ERRHVCGTACLEEAKCPGRIDIVILAGRMHRMADAETGEVINDACVTQQRRVRREVANVVLEEADSVAWKTGEILACAVDQVIDDRDAGALLGKLPHELRP